MTLDQALTISSTRTVDLWRLCVGEHAGWSPDSLREQALDILTEEVERLRGMRCETCRYQTHHIDPAYIIPPICGNLSIPGHSVANVTCASLGNGCNAWEAK
jgi:hypothetical protein